MRRRRGGEERKRGSGGSSAGGAFAATVSSPRGLVEQLSNPHGRHFRKSEHFLGHLLRSTTPWRGEKGVGREVGGREEGLARAGSPSPPRAACTHALVNLATLEHLLSVLAHVDEHEVQVHLLQPFVGELDEGFVVSFEHFRLRPAGVAHREDLSIARRSSCG